MGCTKSTKIFPSIEPKRPLPKIFIPLDKIISQINSQKKKERIKREEVDPTKLLFMSAPQGENAKTSRRIYVNFSNVKNKKYTPDTATSDRKKNKKIVRTLEKEEKNYIGDEEKLITHFKFCFDERTGRAIGFQEK